MSGNRKSRLIIVFFIAAATLAIIGALIYDQKHSNKISPPQPTVEGSASDQNPPSSPTLPQSIGQRTKTAGCIIKDSLPDKDCTPGAVFANVTKEEICTSGYSSKVRDVSVSTKNEVYKEYGITIHTTGEYEIDHLISLELGGSNDIANLWPEAAEPRPGFHEKDKVENYLHNLLCDGARTLSEVQSEIVENWLIIYNEIPN